MIHSPISRESRSNVNVDQPPVRDRQNFTTIDERNTKESEHDNMNLFNICSPRSLMSGRTFPNISFVQGLKP